MARIGKYDTSYARCRSKKGHRWTVMSSIKGYKNCWYCSACKWVGK